MTVIGMGFGAVLGAVLALLAWAGFGLSAAWAVALYVCVTLAISVLVMALHWITPQTAHPPAFDAHSLRSG